MPTEFKDRSFPLGANQREVLLRRYVQKAATADGQKETVAELFWRVSAHIAVAEDTDAEVQKWAESFFEMISSLCFFPNSPTFMGAGTPLGQLAACFVLAIDDDMGKDSDSGIFSTLRHAALIQQTGGGVGFSFSRLRPKGDILSTSNGAASGPISFLKVYDTAFGAIAQGGTRRGANMAVLRVDHPDIESFISCKAKEGMVTNFNISVGLTDEFMKAVASDSDFGLVNPRTGDIVKTVKAKNIFDSIARFAHHNGEPGVLFLDTANKDNPVPHMYTLEATNPCGEQFLGPFENCCLGSINLALHCTEDGGVDWEKLEDTTARATRYLDDVVSANKYVPSVPDLQQAGQRCRRIGLGIMGLADMMYITGVRYGSRNSLDLAGQVMEYVRYVCMRTSIDLARERGSFPVIKGSVYDKDDFKWTPPTPLQPYESNFGRPSIDWSAIVAGIHEHGIRNAAQTTIAPTGTIGTVSGCEGYGCEPAFALAYTRTVKEADNDVELCCTSPLFQRAMQKHGIDKELREKILGEVLETGSCQRCKDLPAEIRRVFVVSRDISADEHVRVQATLQRFVDNSISKTINFPASATTEDVRKAYRTGWELGCKGLTVYVTGSRQEVVLKTKEEEDRNARRKALESSTDGVVDGRPYHVKRPRPSTLTGCTYRTDTPLGEAYVTINQTQPDGEPFELFLNVGKGGSDLAALSEAIGRLMSLILRIPSILSPTDRLHQIVRQLSDIGGPRSRGFGARRVRSLPDGVAAVLREHLSLQEEPRDVYGIASPAPPSPLVRPVVKLIEAPMSKCNGGDICPDCGNTSILNVEGCRKCHSCGYAEC